MSVSDLYMKTNLVIALEDKTIIIVLQVYIKYIGICQSLVD